MNTSRQSITFMERRHTPQSRRSAGLLLDQYLSVDSITDALQPISPLSRFRHQLTRQHKCQQPTRARSFPTADFPLRRIWSTKHASQHLTWASEAYKVSTQQQPEKTAPPQPHAKPIKPAIFTDSVVSASAMPALPHAMTQAAQRIQRWWRCSGTRKTELRQSQKAFSVENASFKIVLDQSARPLAVPEQTRVLALHLPDRPKEQMEQQVVATERDSSECETLSTVPYWVDDEWSVLEEGRYVGRLSTSHKEIDPEELVGKSTTQLLQMSQGREALRPKHLLSSSMDRKLNLTNPSQEADPIPEPEPNRSTSSQHPIALASSQGFRISLKGFRRHTNALQRRRAHLRRKKPAAQSALLAAGTESDDKLPGRSQNDPVVSNISTQTQVVSDPLSGDTEHSYVVFSTPHESQTILRRNDLISIEEIASALVMSKGSQAVITQRRRSFPRSDCSIESDHLRPSTPLGLMGAHQQLLGETERAQDQAQPFAVPHGQPFASKICSVPSLQRLAGGTGLDMDGGDEDELLALGRDVVRSKQHEFLQVLQDFMQSLRPSEASQSIDQDAWAASSAACETDDDLELQAMLREIQQLSMGMGMFPPANPIGLGNHAD